MLRYKTVYKQRPPRHVYQHINKKKIGPNIRTKKRFSFISFNEYLLEEFFSHSSDKEERRNFKLRFFEFRARNKINEGATWGSNDAGPGRGITVKILNTKKTGRGSLNSFYVYKIVANSNITESIIIRNLSDVTCMDY